MSDQERVSCESRVDRATVYARGAVVTRAVRLPEELRSAACTLEVRLGWCALDRGSIRALASGGRPVLAVEVRPIDPRVTVDRGPIEAEVELRAVELLELRQQAQRIDARMRALETLRPAPRLRPPPVQPERPGPVRAATPGSPRVPGS